MRPTWARSRAILGGLQAARAHDAAPNYDNILLPFSINMDGLQYALLKAEGELPCITAQFSKIITESLLRKRPSLEIEGEPEETQTWLLDEPGQDGMPLEATISAAVQEEMATGRCWVFVDHPQVTEAQVDQMSAEERELLRPYPVIRLAEEVINWNYTSDSLGRRMLSFVVVRSYRETYADDPVHPIVREVVWVHRLNERGQYEVRQYDGPILSEPPVEAGRRIQPAARSTDGGGYELIATLTPLAASEPLDYIPAWPLSGKPDLTEPPLMPLIEKEIGLYNKMTRRNHLLYNAATFTPVICADITDEYFDNIVNAGLGSWIKLPAPLNGGRVIDKLETPTEALSDYDRAIAAAIDEMAKLGVRMLASESNQSGVALEIRNAAQTAQLGAMSTAVAATFRQVFRCMIHWRTGVQLPLSAIKFKLSTEFLSTLRDVNALRLVTEWYENGLVPRDVFLHVLTSNDYLPDGYNDDEGQREMRNKTNMPPLEP